MDSHKSYNLLCTCQFLLQGIQFSVKLWNLEKAENTFYIKQNTFFKNLLHFQHFFRLKENNEGHANRLCLSIPLPLFQVISFYSQCFLLLCECAPAPNFCCVFFKKNNNLRTKICSCLMGWKWNKKGRDGT